MIWKIILYTCYISTKTSTNKVFISGITKRNDKCDDKGSQIVIEYFVNLLIDPTLTTIILLKNIQLQ